MIQGAGGGGAVVADDTLGRISGALVLNAEPGAPARADIHHVTIEDCAAWGLVVEWISEATGLTDNRFVRNRDGAIVLSPHNVHRMDASTTFEGNGFNGVAVTGTPNLELATAVTWKPLEAGASYWVRETVTIFSSFGVEAGAELVFAAGTGITFPQNTTDTRAEVSIVGTADAKIVFRGGSPPRATGPGSRSRRGTRRTGSPTRSSVTRRRGCASDEANGSDRYPAP